MFHIGELLLALDDQFHLTFYGTLLGSSSCGHERFSMILSAYGPYLTYEIINLLDVDRR
jgi:hypothetical protein